MKGRDFLSLKDFSELELSSLMDLADRLRDDFKAGTLPQTLRNKSVALIWNAEGFRNRVAFELGIARMGGTAVQVPGRLDEKEPIGDVAAYLDNWFDAIIVRTRMHAILLRLAAPADSPVINARTSHNHPCEVLGDLAFARTVRGSVDGIRVAFVGEATNLCHSWFEAAARLPIHVTQACPEEYAVASEFLAEIGASATGTTLVTQDIGVALRNADVVYTDV